MLKYDKTFSRVGGYFTTWGDRNWCLVARYIRIVEVRGSNPLSSTKPNAGLSITTVLRFSFLMTFSDSFLIDGDMVMKYL